jgi:hypothetical protein
MWSGCLPQVRWTLIDSRDASSVTFQIRASTLLKQPSLHYPDRSVRLDRCEDDYCRKNQKLFSKTSAQTVDQERGGFATLKET